MEEEFLQNLIKEEIMRTIDSGIIFTYIKNIEDDLKIKKDEMEKMKKVINKMAEHLTSPINNAQWVIKHYYEEVEKEMCDNNEENK